jgi:hypothetical protein
MRRAAAFFGVSILLLIIALVAVRLIAGRTEVLYAGIAAIGLGLLYVIWPVPCTKAISMLPNAPFVALYLVLMAGGFVFFAALWLAAVLFPAGLAWFLLAYVVMPRFGPIGLVVCAIVYLTIWILLRKQQWRLVRGVGRLGDWVHKATLQPLGRLIAGIWRRAGVVGQWVKG